MKLQPSVYPNFYKKRISVIREEDSNIFVGRESELSFMWDRLFDLLRGRRTNWSMLAQRKMGKTALMKRFFNVMFWEQNQVVPLYFCLESRKRPVTEISFDMAFTLLKQWTAFITKNPDFEKIQHEIVFRRAVEKINKQDSEKILIELDIFHENKRKVSGKHHIETALTIIKSLTRQCEMPCVLMIDEMQELASGNILNEQGEGIRCEDELFKVVMDPDIWTIGAGSQVSMLAYEVVVNHLANRVRSQKFHPLEQQDSEELVQSLVKRHKFKGYKGIEHDVYNLVGGNPFYIISLLTPSTQYNKLKKKQKKFDDYKDLQEIFNFEVTETGGEIFSFWEKHFDTYHEKLNNDPEGQKGLSYRILRYVAENKERSIYYDEIAKVFQLDKEEVDRKIRQLEKADLLRRDTPEEISGLQDEILSVALLRLYYPALTGKSDPEKMQQELLAEFEKKLNKMETQVSKYRGEVSNIKGANFEEKIKEKAEKGKWKILNGYKVADQLRSVNYTEGRKRYQIDLVGLLKTKTKNGKGRSRPGLIIEVKDRKKKVGIAEVRKFHQAIKLAKKKEKYTKTINLYISTSGFTSHALKYLKQYKISHISGHKV